MKKLLSIIIGMALALGFCSITVAQSTGSTKVVYHIDDAQAQGLKDLHNIRNHLDISPQTTIIVVTYANGVDLLMEGAKDQFTLDADFIPSGVVRVADLQYKDGFAYIKP